MRLLLIGDTNEADGPNYTELTEALRVRPWQGLDLSYWWLQGLVVARFDRAYLFNNGTLPGTCSAAVANGGRRCEEDEVEGFELIGRVLKELPDISDHFAIRFSTLPDQGMR